MPVWWTAEHAADLNIDPARIIIAGTSSGGGLVAATSLLARDRGEPTLHATHDLVHPSDRADRPDQPPRRGHGQRWPGDRWAIDETLSPPDLALDLRQDDPFVDAALELVGPIMEMVGHQEADAATLLLLTAELVEDERSCSAGASSTTASVYTASQTAPPLNPRRTTLYQRSEGGPQLIRTR